MRWTWVICVKAPDRSMSSEAFAEVAIREVADELILRADEVDTAGLHQHRPH